MSPEINGNPPSVTKRKKNRDKNPPQGPKLNPVDFNNMSNCNYFPTNPPNFHPDMSAYYSFLNYSTTPEPMSLPSYGMNYPNMYPSNPNLNFMSTPRHSMMAGLNGEAEYLSLPVGNLDQNGDEEDNKRRFSDPGLPNDSDDNSSLENSIQNKIIQRLTQQVNVLKESNRKLTREVMEMRMEMNLMKQQQSSRHFDREYEPGMLADIIREVRDAARVREDALLARVKHMIEEKQLSINHLQLVGEKNRNNDRITKLEDQLKNLSVNSSNIRSDEKSDSGASSALEVVGTARQVLELEREALELRRELQDTRAKKEEADHKLMQLDKKLSTILRRNDICPSDASEDGKTNSIDSISMTTTTSSLSQQPSLPRVTLSGPVTDL